MFLLYLIFFYLIKKTAVCKDVICDSNSIKKKENGTIEKQSSCTLLKLS